MQEEFPELYVAPTTEERVARRRKQALHAQFQSIYAIFQGLGVPFSEFVAWAEAKEKAPTLPQRLSQVRQTTANLETVANEQPVPPEPPVEAAAPAPAKVETKLSFKGNGRTQKKAYKTTPKTP